MGCTVVLSCCCSLSCIYAECYLAADTEGSALNNTDMSDSSALELNGINYVKACSVSSGYCSDISCLTTHCSIERCLIHDNCSFRSLNKLVNKHCIGCKNRYNRIMNKSVIAYEPGCYCSIDKVIYSSVCAHVVGLCSRISRCLLLNLHSLLKAFLVNGKALLFKNLRS